MTTRPIESMVIDYDPIAQELVIRTAQGTVLVSRCEDYAMTRVVILPNKGGYVTTTDHTPTLLCMWAGVDVTQEPPVENDDTQEMMPMFDESEG